jgi:hypothetical protein
LGIFARVVHGKFKEKIEALYQNEVTISKSNTLEELKQIRELNIQSDFAEVDPIVLSQIYTYQSIIKNFNYSEN